jgi:hypothetical protein
MVGGERGSLKAQFLLLYCCVACQDTVQLAVACRGGTTAFSSEIVDVIVGVAASCRNSRPAVTGATIMAST